MKAFQKIAQCLIARENCKKSGNADWYERHTETIESIVRDHFPHGSGFDCGTLFDFPNSKPDRLIFTTSFHHMDQHGGYDGWSEHSVIVTPSLAFGCNVRVTGKDRNGIKDYIADVFNIALTTEQD